MISKSIIQSWVDEGSSIPEQLVPIFERFLLGSVSVGVSKRTSGFIDELNLVNSQLVTVFLKKMEDNEFQFEFKRNASEVEKAIENNSNQPWDDGEKYICVPSSKKELSTAIDNLHEIKELESSVLREDVKEIVRARFNELDAIFRHLRNALAHGCFRYINSSKNGNGSIFFFDINSSGDVSAIATLSLERLDSWYNLICSNAKKKV